MNESKVAAQDSLRFYNVGYYGRLEFYLFTTSVGLFIAIVSFTLYVIGILEKINLAQVVSDEDFLNINPL